MNTPATLSMVEVAAILRCSIPTLYKIAQEDLPRYKRAGRVIYLSNEVEDYRTRLRPCPSAKASPATA